MSSLFPPDPLGSLTPFGSIPPVRTYFNETESWSSMCSNVCPSIYPLHVFPPCIPSMYIYLCPMYLRVLPFRPHMSPRNWRSSESWDEQPCLLFSSVCPLDAVSPANMNMCTSPPCKYRLQMCVLFNMFFHLSPCVPSCVFRVSLHVSVREFVLAGAAK